MVPCDSDDIKKEYEILLNEVRQYNPQLLATPRVLAISKSDMVDEELKDEIKDEIESIDLPKIFISSVAQKGLTELKDLLWKTLTETEEFKPRT